MPTLTPPITSWQPPPAQPPVLSTARFHSVRNGASTAVSGADETAATGSGGTTAVAHGARSTAAPTTGAVSTATPPSGAAGRGELGKDAFLKLLIAQLRNQDPMRPMEDREFIAQLAQFNAVEQMTQMNQRLQDMLTVQALGQASDLIGRYVQTRVLHNGQLLAGTVQGVTVVNGATQLLVGEGRIPVAIADVVQVSAPPASQAAALAGTSTANASASPLSSMAGSNQFASTIPAGTDALLPFTPSVPAVTAPQVAGGLGQTLPLPSTSSR